MTGVITSAVISSEWMYSRGGRWNESYNHPGKKIMTQEMVRRYGVKPRWIKRGEERENVHLTVNTDFMSKENICPRCLKEGRRRVFTTRSNLQRHISNLHERKLFFAR